jgi:hypothetical protein
MTDDRTEGEKKIIIDEDWKSQVQAEKEAEQQKQQGPAQEQAGGSQAPLPAPTLSFLAGTIYMQGVMALGLLPNPSADKEPTVHVDHARHSIDMLAMLQQKTEGNRTSEESEEIEEMLHQLRMAFVTVTQK